MTGTPLNVQRITPPENKHVKWTTNFETLSVK